MQNFKLGFYVTPSLKDLPWQIEVLQDKNITHIGTDGFCEWRDDKFVTKIASYIRQAEMNLQSFHSPFCFCFAESKG